MAERWLDVFMCTILETDGFGCLWVNVFLCQGANRPNQALSMVEAKHD